MHLQCSYFDQERKARNIFTAVKFAARDLNESEIFSFHPWCKMLEGGRVEIGRHVVRMGWTLGIS